MPTYEYECQKCKRRFEIFQSITASPLKKCRYCKGPLKRLIGSGGGIIFKGPGFYATDYRSKEYKRKEKSEKQQVASKGNSPKKNDKKQKID
jgi:putative FmdB family regulatory protein